MVEDRNHSRNGKKNSSARNAEKRSWQSAWREINKRNARQRGCRSTRRHILKTLTLVSMIAHEAIAGKCGTMHDNFDASGEDRAKNRVAATGQVR